MATQAKKRKAEMAKQQKQVDTRAAEIRAENEGKK